MSAKKLRADRSMRFSVALDEMDDLAHEPVVD